jgi:hypothetical protein
MEFLERPHGDTAVHDADAGESGALQDLGGFVAPEGHLAERDNVLVFPGG